MKVFMVISASVQRLTYFKVSWIVRILGDLRCLRAEVGHQRGAGLGKEARRTPDHP